ncbi:MAG: hypothetical protein KIG85_00070 [Thiopseudomonas sp.]|nr:hypothetical protein [Thiopseudomonas sp.]
MQTYEIVFSGQVAPGVERAQARQGIQRLFNASEPLLDQFFSGRQIVVKRDLDQAAAEKYRQAFASVGALVEVVAMGQPAAAPEPKPAASTPAPAPVAPTAVTQPAPVVAAPPPPPASTAAVAQAAPASGSLKVAPRDEYMAAFAHVEAPDFGLAGVGEDLLENKPEQVVTEVDISGLSLAAPGSDLEQLPGAEPVAAPDTSHLKLEGL